MRCLFFLFPFFGVLLILASCSRTTIAQRHAKKGWEHYRANEEGKADFRFWMAGRKDPRNLQALHGHGQIFFEQRKYSQSFTKYYNAVEVYGYKLDFQQHYNYTYSALYQEKFEKAILLFEELIKQYPKSGIENLKLDEGHSSYEEICLDAAFFAEKLNNTDKAIFFYQKAYNRNSNNPETLISLAKCYAEKNRAELSLSYLLRFYDYEQYDKARNLVRDNLSSFTCLLGSERFMRWLYGIRRLRIDLVESSSDHKDLGLTAPDQYVVIEYNNKVILSTAVRQDRRNVNWSGETVIFDYDVSDNVSIYLLEEDYFENDELARFRGKIYSGSKIISNGNNKLEITISDTNFPVRTSSLETPTDISLEEFLLGVGAIALVATVALDDESFISRLSSCLLQSGISAYINDPLAASIIAEATASVIEKRNISISNTASSAFAGYVAKELRTTGNGELATLVEGGMFLKCLGN